MSMVSPNPRHFEKMAAPDLPMEGVFAKVASWDEAAIYIQRRNPVPHGTMRPPGRALPFLQIAAFHRGLT
jgi:hypothetical protein